MILEVAQALEDLFERHPSFRVPAFRECVAKMRVIREELQLEMSLGVDKPKRTKVKGPAQTSLMEKRTTEAVNQAARIVRGIVT